MFDDTKADRKYRRRVFCVGDIHGCGRVFRELLAQVSPKTEDTVVLIGDLTTRGNHVDDVFRGINELLENGVLVTVVLGNHDERLLRGNSLLLSGRRIYSSAEKTMVADVRALPKFAIDILLNGTFCARIEGTDAIFIHGGVDNTVRTLQCNVPYHTLTRNERKEFQKLCRVRFLDKSGRMVHLDDVDEHHEFWADIYDGRFGQIYFGHQPFISDRPVRFSYATGIDLGAVYGNYLAAVEIGPDGALRECYIVKAQGASAIPPLLNTVAKRPRL